MGESVPEGPQELFCLYWIDKGEDSQPKIYFDDREKASGNSQNFENVPGAERAEKSEQERYACDTSKVDCEIEKLKKK